MLRRSYLIAAVLTLAAFAALAVLPGLAAEGDVIKLFNGKDFTGWKKFLDPKKDGDPDKVFTVKDGTIVITGVPNGYLITEKEYENYVLTLEWQWGEEPGNSGVFVHVSGEDKIWPKGVEAQLQ